MKLQLSDGRVIPVVKPHLGDQLEVERSMKPRLTPAEFRDTMQLTAFQTAFMVFASLRRADVEVKFSDVLEMDLEHLGGMLQVEPGERELLDGQEGEQSANPQGDQTSGETVGG